MLARGLVFILLLVCFSKAHAEVEYKSVKLTSMPQNLQMIFHEIFESIQMRRFLVDSSGSELLGINMLFTDAFALSRVVIKYDVEGNFKLNHSYDFNNFNVHHFKIKDKSIAVMYTGVSTDVITSLISKIQNRFKTSSFSLSPFNSAIANSSHCTRQSATLSIDTSIPTKSAASLLGGCLDNLSSGAEEGSVGMVKSAWNSVSNEFKNFTKTPSKRMGEYWEGVSGGLAKLWRFMQAVGEMIIDSSEGVRTLKAKFGELGQFFVRIYTNVSSLPFQSKVDLICNVIGSLGVDVLLTAITVGAAGGKLGVSMGLLMAKITRIAKIVGKGISLPFKTLHSLSDRMIAGFEKIIKSGNKDILEKKLKVIGCAI